MNNKRKMKKKKKKKKLSVPSSLPGTHLLFLN
jgi:hypothetical protein